jgi:potassium channel subfamily V protein 1
MSTVNDFCKSGMFCRNYNIKLAMPREHTPSSLINLSITRREKPINFLDYIDYVCITWFTFEFFTRCIVSPNKIKFFKSITNWIELFAIIWFYVDLGYNYVLFNNNVERSALWDMAGTIRVMRLFKLFNHYAGLTIIIASLRASAGKY